MKSIKYLFLFVFALMVTITSCKKNNEPAKSKKEILTSKQWKLSSYKDNGVAVVMQDCEKDNVLSLASNGTYTTNPGAIICEVDETIETGTWSLSVDEKSIIVDGTPLTIVELTENKFVLSIVDGNYSMEQTYIPF